MQETYLLMVGLKANAFNKQVLATATHLTKEEQKEFIEFYKQEISPLIDKKIDELKAEGK